jgi:hypothetical protein
MEVLRKLFIIGLIAILASCTSQFKSAEDLQSFITKEKNGLLKSKEVGNINIKIAHRPTDLLINQELNNKSYTEEDVNRLREKYDKYAYFTLSLSANNQEIESYNVSGQGDFGTRVQQLSFGMSDLVEIHTNQQDTVQVADYVYQRTFGVGNSSDMLFAFEKEKFKDSKWLQFQLGDIGLGIGLNRFRFNTKDIKSVPKIQF